MRLRLDGEEVRRNYSLSAPANGRTYRISVKREPKGRVSNHLHDHVDIGSELELFAPAGDFVLHASERPLVFISAGVGITPVLSMLESAVDSGPRRPIYFMHCARNPGVHAFAGRVKELAAAHSHVRSLVCYSEANGGDACGLLSRELLARWLPVERDVDVYFLGPKPFMAATKRNLRALGVPESQSYFEFFGPAAALE